MIDNRVRIVLQHEGEPHYFVRFNTETNIEAVPFEQIRQAVLFRRDVALDLCKKINARGFKAQIITPGGVILYGDQTAPPPPAPKTQERGPMQCAGILLTPGNAPRNGYFVRFLGTSYESLWAPTAEEVYQKLIEHPLAKTLLPLAERYIAPPVPQVDPETERRRLEFARQGRLRPADL